MEEQEVEKTEEVELPTGETKRVSYTETEMVEVETTEYVPGVFGYTYLTRVVYTEDADGDVPQYIQDYEATGSLDVVEAGEPVPFSEQEEFDAEGNRLDDEQTTFDLQEMYPEQGAPDIDEMEKADLGTLADEELVEGIAPAAEQDALHGADDGALAVIETDDGYRKVMPSNNMSYDERSESASSVVGPYRLNVEDRAPVRIVTVERTR